jgi:hypothetical protein
MNVGTTARDISGVYSVYPSEDSWIILGNEQGDTSGLFGLYPRMRYPLMKKTKKTRNLDEKRRLFIVFRKLKNNQSVVLLLISIG